MNHRKSRGGKEGGFRWVWARTLSCPHLPFWKQNPDVSILTGILLVVALALAAQHSLALYIFTPNGFYSGDWWRLFTWPFAHVSLYHLLLDGMSFVFLYHALQPLGNGWRRGITLATFVGSLLAAALAPGFSEQGLCGLSGPAHGLMAILALSFCLPSSSKSERWLGATVFVLVLLKTLVEAFTGHVVLESFHIGAIGSPNPYTHLGGILGGLAAWSVRHRSWFR